MESLKGLANEYAVATCLLCIVGHFGTYALIRSPPGKRHEWANFAFSSVFQVLFVSSAMYAFWELRTGVAERVVHNHAVHVYQCLGGYFVYDLLYLVLHGTEHTGFILHHIAAIIFVNMFVVYGFSALWFNLLFAAMGEGANPFLSLRQILRYIPGEASLLYKLNQTILVGLYLVLRVVGFPLILAIHLPEVLDKRLPWYQWVLPFAVTMAVWAVGLGWFSALWKEWYRVIVLGKTRDKIRDSDSNKER